MMIIVLSAVAVVLALVLRVLAPAKAGKRAPGPKPWPIVGSSHLIGNETSPFVQFTRLADKYGDIYSIRLGATECVVVSGMSTIRSVLMQNGKFFGGRPDFIRYSKLFADDRQNSLALCDWCDLQVKRRNIARKYCDPRQASPLRRKIRDVGDFEMREMVTALRHKSLEAHARREDLDLKPFLMTTCLNIFTQYMCSLRFDPERDADFARVAQNFDEVFWEINQGYAVDFFPWLLPFYDSHMKKLTKWSTDIRAFILTRIINMRELSLDDDDSERDFTDGLLKALKHETLFTREAILFTLEDFLGGSAAVANLVMLTLGMLVKHPDVAARIQREVDEITGGARPISIEDVENMPYSVAVIRENLRYSSSPIVPHVATETAVVNGYTIEKGTVIIINNYKMNMNDDLWEDPSEFRPERFLNRTYVERRGSEQDSGMESDNEPTDTQKILNRKSLEKREVLSLKTNMPHFIPFSIGKRTCLGKGLLMNYGLLTLATVLQNFDVSCRQPEDIKTFTACVALPPNTFGLTLTPRKKQQYLH